MIQFIAAFSLAVGYRTRLSCVVVFLLLTSLHTYVPWVLNGGDDTMRIFLLWGCFLPLGRRWSVDAALRNVRDDALASHDPAYAQLLERRRRRDWSPHHDSVCSSASIAFKLNLVLLYVIAAGMKTDMAWSDGTAVHYALYLMQYTTWLALPIRRSALLARLATQATMVVEIYGPLLYLQPYNTALTSMLAVILFVGLHGSFWVALTVGLFSPACICVHLAHLPGPFFEWCAARFATPLRRHTKLIYDIGDTFTGVTLHIVKQFWLSSYTEVWPSLPHEGGPQKLSSAHAMAHFPGFSERMLQMVSVSELRRRGVALAILESSGDGVHFPNERTRWRLVSSLAPLPGVVRRSLGALFSWIFETNLWQLTFEKLRETASQLKPRQSPAAIGQVKVWRQRIINVVVALWFSVGLWSDLQSVGMVPSNTRLDTAAMVLHVNQWWSMFAPGPGHGSGYYLVVGETNDGRLFDFDIGGPAPTSLIPFNASSVPDILPFASARWRRAVLFAMQSSVAKTTYGMWLCRNWNSVAGRLQMSKIRFALRTVQAPPPGYDWRDAKPVVDDAEGDAVDCATGAVTRVKM